MLTKRVIVRLDIKYPQGLVKGIRLEGFRCIGDPLEYVMRYYDDGIDEVWYQDIVASLYNRGTIDDLIMHTTRYCFVPVCVGGGIRVLDDALRVLRIGADKVAINTGVFNNFGLIRDIVSVVGSQSTVISVEVGLYRGRYECFINCGRDHTGMDPVEWVGRVVDAGVGEVIITFIDRDGRMCGMDLDFIRRVSGISVPLVVHGGIGSMGDVLDAFGVGVDGVVIASCFHYNRFTVSELKSFLHARGVYVRR